MVIQIDDSGWGNLVGGVVIGVLRKETREYVYQIIDVKYFQERFDSKEYFNEASKISIDLLNSLKYDEQELIEICSGIIHKKTKEEFKQRNYPFNEIKIEGELQDKIENTFKNYQESLGCKTYGSNKEKEWVSGFNMEKIWIREDYVNRKKYGKYGWDSWSKHFGDIDPNPIEIDETKSKCDKCGSKLIIQWRHLSNGKKNIRMDCPTHGYVGYAPIKEPYITFANRTQDKNKQQTFEL